MKADTLNLKDLFQGRIQFEIPAFQRPYVWSEEQQWAPLWADVRRVALGVIEASSSNTHFLGAVVLKEIRHDAGDVARSAVIDGQQRMTTLQILLDASQSVVAELGYEDEAEALEELILNSARRFVGTKERFKLWPSRSDRAAFEAVMDDAIPMPIGDHRVGEAHRYFGREVRRWLVEGADEGETPVADESARVTALADVLQSRLQLVAINLGIDDDDQLIFETLNDRGTPLLAADLIKNWVFQRAEDLNADVNSWADEFWAELDEEWWRREISQGRHLRSRIDIFLQYWLTMRLKDEVSTDGVFRRFRGYAAEAMTDVSTAEALLAELRRDANTFRSFAELPVTTVAGRFYKHVVESFELAATTPLLLWILSENHEVPEDQIAVALGSLESWVVRRTLLRMTMKDVNKLMVAMLVMLDGTTVDRAGEAVRAFLDEQTADARIWPSDSQVVGQLPRIRLYGNVRQERLRIVLQGIELHLRTEKNEKVSLPEKLEIEHLMPRTWRTHWDSTPPLGAEAAVDRARRIDTLGNLTLVTQKLNGSLSHRPWTDAEAAPLAASSNQVLLGKRSLIERYALLMLSKTVVNEHPNQWTEADIRARGIDMAQRICAVWAR